MRRSFVWLFLLLQGATITCAGTPEAGQARGHDSVQKDGTESTIPLSPADTDVVSGREQADRVKEPGFELVDAALDELSKIYRPSHHKARRRRGTFGTVLHYVSKAIPSFHIRTPPQENSNHVASGPLLEAVKLLEQSSQGNNSDALYLLAQLNFYGNYSYPKDFKAAFDYYHRLADLTGNSSALHMLGFMYSTGLGAAVERDQAKALLYYTFAAAKGNIRAEMTVASRHHTGIGTPKSCEAACKFYKRVADKSMEWYRSGPPGGMSWVHQPYRIADEAGGIYGEGASVVSSGLNALRAHPNSDAYASIDDIIEYMDLMSQKGDFKSSFNLGRIFYEGQRGLDRDLHLAKKYFLTVASKYWRKDGRIVENFKPQLDKIASKAAGYIGRMYMRGEGVEQNFDRAKPWFERGIAHGDAQSQYCMGLLLMNGYGGPKNIAKATDLFKAASEQDYAFAQVEMGALFLDQGQPEDLRTANDYFELAIRYGNIEAQYYLAEMIHHGIGRDKACGQALVYYKNVAERADPLVSSWFEANEAYEDGDYDLAILGYLGAAEQGYEKAQNNVGYLLDSQQSSLPLPSWLVRRSAKTGLLNNPSLGLIEWTRSSRQGNIDSLVKMGDYYLRGIGVDKEVDRAVQCYTGAAEYHQSAQALYNLGWMHENGIGLNQDYHLAKRYYDAALATNEEAYLPVTLSLLKLRAKSAWNTFTNGRINSIQDEPAPKKDWSLGEWVTNFLQDERLYYDDAAFDDIYDDTMPGGDSRLPDDIDDGIMESLIIIGLAAALVFLIYYRQQRQQAHRREEEEEARRRQQGGQNVGQAPPRGEDRGVFPPRGGPDMADWAVGGIGH